MSALLSLLVALAAEAFPVLPSADQAAIMKVLCQGKLEKDAWGWVCRGPGEDDDGAPFEQHWVSAHQGRFVSRPDEWLVSIRGSCTGRFCPAWAHVFRKVGGTWRGTHEIELDAALREDCVRFGGMADGLDRMACVEGSGPYQGFMSMRLAVMSFADGQQSVQTLMQKELGGECFLTPPGKEMEDDDLELRRAQGEPPALFAARLRVRRAPCDPSRDEGAGPMFLKAEHVLRFVRRGSGVAPDESSARIIAAQGWSPEAR